MCESRRSGDCNHPYSVNIKLWSDSSLLVVLTWILSGKSLVLEAIGRFLTHIRGTISISSWQEVIDVRSTLNLKNYTFTYCSRKKYLQIHTIFMVSVLLNPENQNKNTAKLISFISPWHLVNTLVGRLSSTSSKMLSATTFPLLSM